VSPEHPGARGTYASPNRRVWFEDEIAAWQVLVDEFDPTVAEAKGAPGFYLTA